MDPISSISHALSDCTFVLSDASPLGDRAFQLASSQAQNALGGVPSFAKLDPRAGTSLVEQAQASGKIVSVHSTSSTLLQTIPTLFQLASEQVPAVFHVDSRQAAADGTLVESHTRILAARQTGFAMLSSESPQEAHDLALLASLASLHSGVPFLHFFNASAVYAKGAKEASAEAVKALVPQEKLAELRARFTKAAPTKKKAEAAAAAAPPQGEEQQRREEQEREEQALSELAAVLDHYAGLAGKALGAQFTPYQPFEYVGSPQATHVLVALSAGSSALEEAVSRLVASQQAVGLVKVRLYRPWLEERFLQVLPSTVQRLTVLEQVAPAEAAASASAASAAASGWGPLFMDVAGSFTGERWASGAAPPAILFGQFTLPVDVTAAQGLFGQATSGFVLAQPQAKAKGKEPAPASGQGQGQGEDSSYVKMLRQVFGDTLVLANATGYASVWGKAASQATTQSLLASAPQQEVGAEYGLGLYLAFTQRRERLADQVARVLEDPSVPKSDELRQALSLWLRHKDDPKLSRRHAAPLADRLLPAASAAHPSLRELYLQRELLPLATHWLVGADDWSYDVNASGIHHVLSAGENVNLLILDTEPYTQTVGRGDRSSARKKDIGLYAMSYGGAYVASIALYASYSQAIRALVEAASFPGPSVVLAYLPRVAPQGQAEGEARFPTAASEALAVLKETKQAVDAGHWPLYRWNPAHEDHRDVGAAIGASPATAGVADPRGHHFALDSQRIQQDLRDFLARENSLSLLASSDPTFAANLASSADGTRRAHHARLNQEAADSFSRLLGGLKKGKPLLILFASDGGNAERVARRLEDGARRRNLDVRCSAMDEYAVEDLGQEPHVCLVVSTAGQGEFPTNGREFWKKLSEQQVNLSGVKFGVFSLGDSHYWPLPEDAHYFCKPGVDLDAKLALDGAERLLPLGLGDDQALDGYETALQAWEPALWKALGAEEEVGGEGAAKPKAKTVEDIKDESNFLRGTIMEGLADTSTGALAESDTALTKFHGIYQQDDRDLREERRKQGLEKAFSFMVRVRVPGGIATPAQWLAMDEIADSHANGTIRITTRQAFQVHGVIKRNLRQTIRDINRALMDTIAACGDVNRNVMCNPNPHLSEVHAEVQAFAQRISDHLTPRTSAYHEIWLEDKQVAGGQPATRQPDEEPIYGKHYLPRKFKMAIAIPPNNDVDVFAHCLGYIAIVEEGRLVGYNVTVGGGMGMTHNNKKTFPRLADLLGFCTPDQAVAVGEHVLTVQRDFGDRTNRKHSRLKYTVEDFGIDWYRERVEERLGAKLQPPRPFTFTDNSDRYGWTQGAGGLWHYCLFVQNGRVKDTPAYPLRTGLREIAKVHRGDFRLTPNQHLIIGSVSPQDKPMIEALLGKYGMSNERHSAMRLNSMACVALPTCGLAFAESERYLPDLIGRLEETLEECGLTHDAITIRMTGCPNGCARPYLAEIAFVGKAPGVYNLYLGAGFSGERLNKLFKESVNEEQILAELRPLLKRYALERLQGEHFGDFVIRAGVVKATKAGNDFHS